MTRQQQSNRAATPNVDLRWQTLCAAGLLGLAIAAAPATAIGASEAATNSAGDAATTAAKDDSAKDDPAKDDPANPARAGGYVSEAEANMSSERFVPRKGVDDLLAGELLEANVVSGEGENIGEVDDILIGPDGQVHALVVEVGGILGMGEKPVAVRFERFARDVNDDGMLRLKLEATVDELKAAPKFIPFHEVRQ